MWLRDKYPNLRSSHLLTNLLVAVLVFSFIFALTIFRIEQAPDVFTDEIIYTRAGIRTAGEGALVWDSGDAFLIHPPLYFIVEAIYFTFAGNPYTPLYDAGDIFANVFSARQINAFLAGLTATLLYFFGKRLHSDKLGLLLALIFSLDPFVLRINRRAMLETMAGLLVTAGLAMYFIHSMPAPARRASMAHLFNSLLPKPGLIIAGLLFGLALLTKELAFIGILTVILFAIYEFIVNLLLPRRSTVPNHFLVNLIQSIFPAFVVISIAGSTYFLYPLWALRIGEWAGFSQEKILGAKRLLGLVQLTGWNRPGFSLLDYLFQRLVDYGSSYALIALGGLATLGLFIWARHLRPARLLIAWGVTLYPIFAFITIAGSGNDQFFYFLLVPAIILVGYASVTVSELKKVRLPFQHVSQYFARKLPLAERFVPLLLLLLVMPYDVFQWWTKYAIGEDNGYAKFTQFAKSKLPPLEPLNATGDPVKFHYFFPSRLILDAETPQEAIKENVHYFSLAPKDVRYRYGETSPELAAWIQKEGKLLFTYNGDSYGDIYLYYVDFPGKPGDNTHPQESEGRHWRSYQAAKSGFVGTLIISLSLWLFLCGILTLLVYRLHHLRKPEFPDHHKPLPYLKFSPIALIKSWFL